MFRCTMLVVRTLLFLTVVAHPLGEAILNLSAAEGGIAFRLFSEDMSDFFFFFVHPVLSPLFLILAGVLVRTRGRGRWGSGGGTKANI